ncbi:MULTISPECIES: hypothetical protein [Pacificibacter]|uniref:hypothetical protein n=1 Tax=Pacificibacter TaxID=1042323 RepID=UPI001C0A0D20|nr:MULTISPECIES: hypothetical protein [Pacificibacter]MBU2937529.1 hypothetical protein [Pacificibacter marinus]MDO6615709.1 hypothetical protein [Pacificibacter sp. 1_MG-2023]
MSRENYLDEFSNDLSFPLERACIDKVDCTIGKWVIRGEPEAIRSYIAHSAEDMLACQSDEEQKIFRDAAPSSLTRRVIIETRGNPRSPDEQHLIFAGALTGTNPTAPKQTLTLVAKLNVTRGIQAQQLIGRVRPPQPKIKGPYRLTICPSENASNDESAYIPATNILMGSNFRYAYAASKPPSMHLIDNVKAVYEAIHAGFNKSVRWSGVNVEPSFQFGMRGIEVYWEFACKSPLSAVELLTPQLVSAVDKSRTRSVAIIDTEISRQSKSIQLELEQDMIVRAYAKTTKRIRVEVSFGKKAIEKLVGKRTCTSEADITTKVDRLVLEASTRLTELFGYIKSTRDISHSHILPDDLLREINGATDDPNIAAHILDGLTHHGRIIPEYNPSLLKAVRKLRARRVMRLIRKQVSAYALTPAYQRAFEDMRLSTKSK